MIFHPTSLVGAYVIELEKVTDQRGFFARAYCEAEVVARGLEPCGMQCNVSFNAKKGTLRGMHYQVEPKAEAKIVRCTRGRIHDVIVDLRPDSPTYRRWASAELAADNHRCLYIPVGLAHGFQTLTDDAEIFYQMSTTYSAPHARGVRWNDLAFAIDWPLPVTVISSNDASYHDFV